MFLPYLTVLRIITTLWHKMSENSYLHHFSAQVSQIVFLAYLTVLRLFTTVWPTENVRKLLSPPFQCTSITKRFLSLFDRFTTYYNCMTWNVRKISVHKYHKSCFSLISPFNGLLQPYDLKFSENSYLCHFSAPFQCTSITNRVLSLFVLQLYDLKCQKTYLHKYHKAFS